MTNAEKEKTIIDFIKDIEKNIYKFNDAISNSIRNDTIPLLYKLNNINTSSNLNNQLINKWISYTKKFAKNNPNILFTRTDKENGGSR